MKKCLFIILLVAVTMAQTDADQAEFLLQDLYRDAQNNYKDLQDTWKQNGGLLQDNVSSWEHSLSEQTQECETRDGIVEDAVNQQQENERLIQWISETTKTTLVKYDKLYTDRCAANRNYISGLKNDKILLNLIKFLRTGLQNAESMSLIQKREFASVLMQFMSLYRSDNTKQLLQLHLKLHQDGTVVQAGENEAQPGQDQVNDSDFEIDNQFDTQQRSDEEIGEGHVDDNRAQIDLDNFDSSSNRTFAEYKAELLGLLDEMEQQITVKVGQSQEDEVAAGIATAEFRLKLEKEMQELDARLYEEVVFSSTIARRITEVNGNAQRCHVQLEKVSKAYDDAIEDYEAAFAKFNAKKTDLEEELEIFQYVLSQYQSSVGGSEYREQIDDYTQDGAYDDSYDGREVDEIDFINPEDE